MGFFSINEHSNLASNFEFPALEGYCGTIGCAVAMVEGYQNDWALFEAQVYSDMHEIQLVHEGGDVTALQEASLGGMWEAIKKFFIKLGAKIKAIFTAFMAKLEGYFTKDLKAYVKKYEKSLNGKDFKDMKVKCGKPKKDTYSLDKDPFPEFDYSIASFATSGAPDENVERSDKVEGYYKAAGNSGATDAKDFDEWYHEQLYEDEESHDDWDAGKVRACASRLSNNTKAVSDIDKHNKSIMKDIKKIIDDIDKVEKEINSKYKGNSTDKAKLGGMSIKYNYNADTKEKRRDGSSLDNVADDKNGTEASLSDATKQVAHMRMLASAYQEVVMHICQTIMKEAKYGIAQDRKVFAAGVAYKKISSESTLIDMISECAADEVDEYFNNENYVMA